MEAAIPMVLAGVTSHDDLYEAVEGADAVVLMSEWNQYRGLDLLRLRDLMRGEVFVDLRNVCEREVMCEAGFDYHCVGR